MVAMTSVASYGGDDISAYDNYGTFWRTIIMYIYTALVALTENQLSQFIHKYPYHTLLKNPFSTQNAIVREDKGAGAACARDRAKAKMRSYARTWGESGVRANAVKVRCT